MTQLKDIPVGTKFVHKFGYPQKDKYSVLTKTNDLGYCFGYLNVKDNNGNSAWLHPLIEIELIQ